MDKQKILNEYLAEVEQGEDFFWVYETGEDLNYEAYNDYDEGGIVFEYGNYYIAEAGKIGQGFKDFQNMEVFINKIDAIEWVKKNEHKK